ncbi:MAG: septum formation protein Maf [Salinivirgaceae bacterium]|nr:septum formation protein Maf [Salinivirgaceae bacterium]
MLPIFNKYKFVLASKSPRRQELLKGIVPEFDIMLRDTAESYPDTLQGAQIVEHLAKLKASAFEGELAENQLLITADTIVWIDNQVLGKPKNRTVAIEMLHQLSGRKHMVYTGVCLKTTQKERLFSAATDVFFRQLSDDEIAYYVDTYKPFDKAGSYGIQEWIGYVGIERIDGSYFNVMGLPVQRLYQELKKF